MGKAASTLIRRPVKNWNIEHRAQQFLEKQQQERPQVAPKHPSTKDALDKFVLDHPEITEEVKRKDENLAHMLKGLVVEPSRVGEIVTKSNSQRALPVDRAKLVDSEFGYLEPEVIRPGRCSIRQAMEFLSDHANDPMATGSAESIARRYKLDVHRVRHVLHYFHVFNVHLPKKLADTMAKTADQQSLLRQGISPKNASLDSGKQDPAPSTSNK